MPSPGPAEATPRPAVSVVVPFAGSPATAKALREALDRLVVRPGDEVLVVDDTIAQSAAGAFAGSSVRVLHGTGDASSSHARNAGARAAATDWLLFVDADCRPEPALADAYFVPPLERRCGAAVGGVLAAAGAATLVGRYAAARGHLDRGRHAGDPYRPFGATANLLVRRRAWLDLGGFHEGLRSGEDADFCWRLQEAGWRLAHRPGAVVAHCHRQRLIDLLGQSARYATGNAWLARRHPGSRRPPDVASVPRNVAAAGKRLLLGRREEAAYALLDAAWVAAEAAGRLRSNAVRATPAPARAPASRAPLVVLADEFPVLSETFVVNEVRMLADLGHRVRVEAGRRPLRTAPGAAAGIPVSYFEDDGLAGRLADLAWLAARHPLRCARDAALRRRRWGREEQTWPLRTLAAPARRLARGGERHLHAHFAGSAALAALRLGRLLDRPYSVTAHAYDIYLLPRNLREKLVGAAFATSGCAYTVGHLRGLLGPGHAHRVHEVVMGVDGRSFRRRRPHSAARSVLAVGRLVEKKGFADLVRAAALADLGRLRIVGEGPLRGALEALVDELGLRAVVELPGALDPDGVRDAMEEAAVLAMPCVVAPDGDRDSMPVVVKEALAMEIPVVATDEVGLPQVVEDGWGRLVPPRDPPALAAALDEILSLPLERRIGMGRAGRARVLEAFELRGQTEKLSALVEEAAR